MISSESIESFKSLQFSLDILDDLEVIVLFKGNSKRNVVFHLAEVLDRSRIRIVIIQLPLLPLSHESFKAWRSKVNFA